MLATEPQIIERYVKTGRVKLVFRDVLNHNERSERASEAAACAGKQGKFWEMHGLLFQEQPTLWATNNAGQLDLMLAFGEKVAGLDKAAFAQCLNDRATLVQLQAADAEQRTRGINTQPIFEIGEQRLYGALPVEAFAKVIDALATPQQFPDVLKVVLTRQSDGLYDVAVTLSSPYDTPERYADGWRVMDAQGNVLGVHTLSHDHAAEQPFTRVQSGLRIPPDVLQVTVQSRDKTFGFGGTTMTVTVPSA